MQIYRFYLTMDIIYHEKKINYTATIKALVEGDSVVFPYTEGMETSTIRNICSRIKGAKFTVNKTSEGVSVTRLMEN